MNDREEHEAAMRAVWTKERVLALAYAPPTPAQAAVTSAVQRGEITFDEYAAMLVRAFDE